MSEELFKDIFKVRLVERYYDFKLSKAIKSVRT